MAEFMTGLKRSCYCGELRASDIGREVTLCGWTQRQRDLGQLIFIDLRDRTGIVQLAFDDNTDRAVFDKAFTVRSEFVLAARGIVRERSSKNKDIPTGDIELEVKELRILGQSETPPFEIVDDCKTAELTRLRYRYLDLRRPQLQQNLIFRHKVAKVTRDRMMVEFAKEYPWYAFEKNKGYGTAAHYDGIREHGTCPIHRMTFLKNFER